MARSTSRTSLLGRKPHHTIPEEPTLRRPPQTILGCHYSDPLSPFPLPQPQLQDRGPQLTLASHNGPQRNKARGVLIPKLLTDIPTILSIISHNKSIGTLVQAKQCLVIKIPNDRPANAPMVGGQQLAS